MSVARARSLRRSSTDVERIMWRRLRDRRLDGFKFRRQRPIDPFVVDFVCLEAKLIVEVDGGQHAWRAEDDACRSRMLERDGFQVIRFWNREVVDNLDGVLEVILAALRAAAPSRAPAPSPQPSPRGERGLLDTDGEESETSRRQGARTTPHA